MQAICREGKRHTADENPTDGQHAPRVRTFLRLFSGHYDTPLSA